MHHVSGNPRLQGVHGLLEIRPRLHLIREGIEPTSHDGVYFAVMLSVAKYFGKLLVNKVPETTLQSHVGKDRQPRHSQGADHCASSLIARTGSMERETRLSTQACGSTSHKVASGAVSHSSSQYAYDHHARQMLTL